MVGIMLGTLSLDSNTSMSVQYEVKTVVFQ